MWVDGRVEELKACWIGFQMECYAEIELCSRLELHVTERKLDMGGIADKVMYRACKSSSNIRHIVVRLILCFIRAFSFSQQHFIQHPSRVSQLDCRSTGHIIHGHISASKLLWHVAQMSISKEG